MSDPIAPTPAGGVHAAIRRAADATGVDFSLLVETARRESAFNPGARAATSSATGLFQFIESTWLDMVRRHGGAHGLSAEAAALANGADVTTRREILALRNDPELSARMAGELARENASYLQNRLGRAPSAGELYAAHVMGPAGAARLIEAAAAGAPSAAALFPREANANQGLFYQRTGEARSAQALLDRLGVDATAHVGARGAAAPRGRAADEDGLMAPALAQALFTLALTSLTAARDEAQADHFEALSAYARAQRELGA